MKLIKENFNPERLITKGDLIYSTNYILERNERPYLLGVKFTNKYRKYLETVYGDLKYTNEQIDELEKKSKTGRIIPITILLAIEEIQRTPGMEYTANTFYDDDTLKEHWPELGSFDIISIQNYNKARRAKTIIDKQFRGELITEIIRMPDEVIESIKEYNDQEKFNRIRTESKNNNKQAGIIFKEKFYEDINVKGTELLEVIDMFIKILYNKGITATITEPSENHMFEAQLCDLVITAETEAELNKELKKLEDLKDIIEIIK